MISPCIVFYPPHFSAPISATNQHSERSPRQRNRPACPSGQRITNGSTDGWRSYPLIRCTSVDAPGMSHPWAHALRPYKNSYLQSVFFSGHLRHMFAYFFHTNGTYKRVPQKYPKTSYRRYTVDCLATTRTSPLSPAAIAGSDEKSASG